MITTPTSTRFLAKVPDRPDGGCWLWAAARNERSYGTFRVGPRKQYAHRVSYELFVGEVPLGLVVRPTCDCPPCVNPAHLVVGTHLENMADARSRDMFVRGRDHHKAKFTVEDIRTIREARDTGVTLMSLAAEFGVSHTAISRIANGTRWAHV